MTPPRPLPIALTCGEPAGIGPDIVVRAAQSGAAEVVSADCGCLLNINGCFVKQGDALRGEHLASFLLRRTASAGTGGAR